MQYFKETDDKEKKVFEIFRTVLQQGMFERENFYQGAYEAYPLGDVLFNLDRSPLAQAISLQVFRSSFFAIHRLFTRPGTFDFYLDVFKAIFGGDVDIEFVVPGPGHLQINIEVLNQATEKLMAREIVGGAYEYIEIVDHDGDNIMVQVARGPKTQSEIDAIMSEIKPHGIFVETNLVV